MIRNPLYRHPGIKILRRSLRRELRLQFVAIVFLLGFGMYLVMSSFQKSIILGITGLAITMISIRLLHRSIQYWKVEDHPLIQVLFRKPNQIVWVYSMVTESLPFGFQFHNRGTLYFKMVDGNEFSVAIPAKHLKLVSRTLNRQLPHASFGFTEDRQRLYRTNPEALRKNSKRR